MPIPSSMSAAIRKKERVARGPWPVGWAVGIQCSGFCPPGWETRRTPLVGGTGAKIRAGRPPELSARSPVCLMRALHSFMGELSSYWLGFPSASPQWPATAHLSVPGWCPRRGRVLEPRSAHCPPGRESRITRAPRLPSPSSGASKSLQQRDDRDRVDHCPAPPS